MSQCTAVSVCMNSSLSSSMSLNIWARACSSVRSSGQISSSSICLNTLTFDLCSHRPTATGVSHAASCVTRTSLAGSIRGSINISETFANDVVLFIVDYPQADCFLFIFVPNYIYCCLCIKHSNFTNSGNCCQIASLSWGKQFFL